LARQRLRGRDIMVLAAALTFFGGVALIPLALVAVALTAAVSSPDRVTVLADGLFHALPATLGAPAVVDGLVRAGLNLHPTGIVLALVPVTVYGEGLRRVLLRLQGQHASGGQDLGTSWRGRLAVLPLILLTPALLYPLLLVTRAVAELLDRGGVATVAAVVLGYYTVLGVLLVPVGWTFRVVAAGRVRLRPLVVGSFLTAASLSGFFPGPRAAPAPAPGGAVRWVDRGGRGRRQRSVAVPAAPRAAGGVGPHPSPCSNAGTPPSVACSGGLRSAVGPGGGVGLGVRVLSLLGRRALVQTDATPGG